MNFDTDDLARDSANAFARQLAAAIPDQVRHDDQCEHSTA